MVFRTQVLPIFLVHHHSHVFYTFRLAAGVPAIIFISRKEVGMETKGVFLDTLPVTFVNIPLTSSYQENVSFQLGIHSITQKENQHVISREERQNGHWVGNLQFYHICKYIHLPHTYKAVMLYSSRCHSHCIL